MAMVSLAANIQNAPVPLSDIARQSDISLSYLEQLVSGLRRDKLVKSYRGPGGGYSLALPAAEISIAQILKAAEHSTPGQKNKAHDGWNIRDCVHTDALFNHIGEYLGQYLQTISLADLLTDKHLKQFTS